MRKCLSLAFVDHIELDDFALSCRAWSLQTGHLAHNFFLGAARARNGSALKRLCIMPFSADNWLLIQIVMSDNSLAKRYSFICVLGVDKRLLDGLRNLCS